MFAMAEENDAETVNADKSADDGIGKENISDEAILQEAAVSADDDMREDNPNRQMTPEEIAAMFAMAEENDAETVNADKFEEEEPGEQENASMNEVEVDLADMSELEELLGIKDISAQNEENSIKSEAAEVENKISLEEKNERSLEETKNPASDLENEELTDILDMLGTDDGDLAEINELLKKSDQHELVDDEMLAMLESVSDEEQKEKNVSEEDSAKETEDSEKSNVEKSKKKRWGKRKRSEPQEAGKAEPDADSEQKEEEHRPGFWGNLFKALLDEEEEEEADTSAEDAEKKESAIKGKKDKGKKKKKAPETNEEILEELAEEDVAVKKGKKKKEKKPGKEKNTKKAKAVDLKKFEPEEPLKKMPRKMMVRIFILCFSIMAVIILVAMFVPQLLQKAEARKAFYKGKYEEAYQGLVGKELSESDEILLQKIEVVLLLEKKVQAYEAYMLAGQNAEALNALLEGVAFYQEKSDLIDSLGIRSEASGKYNNILMMLLDKYGLEEEETIEMTGLDAISYTKRVREIVGAGQAENGVDSENKSVDNHAASGNENAAQNENQPPEEPLDDPLQEELD